jgi:hypothetical protein
MVDASWFPTFYRQRFTPMLPFGPADPLTIRRCACCARSVPGRVKVCESLLPQVACSGVPAVLLVSAG